MNNATRLADIAFRKSPVRAGADATFESIPHIYIIVSSMIGEIGWSMNDKVQRLLGMITAQTANMTPSNAVSQFNNKDETIPVQTRQRIQHLLPVVTENILQDALECLEEGLSDRLSQLRIATSFTAASSTTLELGKE